MQDGAGRISNSVEETLWTQTVMFESTKYDEKTAFILISQKEGVMKIRPKDRNEFF